MATHSPGKNLFAKWTVFFKSLSQSSKFCYPHVSLMIPGTVRLLKVLKTQIRDELSSLGDLHMPSAEGWAGSSNERSPNLASTA